jgi:hypothetical protein
VKALQVIAKLAVAASIAAASRRRRAEEGSARLWVRAVALKGTMRVMPPSDHLFIERFNRSTSKLSKRSAQSLENKSRIKYL